MALTAKPLKKSLTTLWGRLPAALSFSPLVAANTAYLVFHSRSSIANPCASGVYQQGTSDMHPVSTNLAPSSRGTSTVDSAPTHMESTGSCPFRSARSPRISRLCTQLYLRMQSSSTDPTVTTAQKRCESARVWKGAVNNHRHHVRMWPLVLSYGEAHHLLPCQLGSHSSAADSGCWPTCHVDTTHTQPHARQG